VSGARLAVYFSPPPDSALAAFGRSWLGRDAERGTLVEPLRPPGLDAERLAAITAEPRRYGFHATLKAPFALAPGATRAAVGTAAAALARAWAPFHAPPLVLRAVDGFLALVGAAPSAIRGALAADCVRHLDPFRAPLTEADRSRRPRAMLTERQRLYLEKWGYPWVMEDFRFHLTLTARLDPDERRRVETAVTPHVAPFAADPLRVDAICLFEQPAGDAPFVLVERYPFAATPWPSGAERSVGSHETLTEHLPLAHDSPTRGG
jgi:putative phosphonate metabolism protein